MVIGILVVVVLLILYIISIYNNIVRLKEAVVNAQKQISVQLDRRGKVFDSLINTVKKYMDYEKSTLKEVIELRQKAIALNADSFNSAEAKAIEDKISQIIGSGALSSSFQMTMEAYPELKANENMMHLQEEIVSTENKLSYAKQGYNDAIEEYNATIASFPDNIVVAKFPKLKAVFEYWELSKERIEQEESKRVEF